MQDSSRYQPVIIIGAPRSGTNMLRDVMCKLPGVGTWPCDEINYIWRHGNISANSDVFSQEYARPEVCAYIREQFDKRARTGNLSFVVEKTCANSLRVPFVRKIFPQAKFVFIYRNGIDVIASANLRWTAKLDIRYVLEKTRFVPTTDFPYYLFRFFRNRIYRLLSREGRLAFWGPQLEDMDELLSVNSLEQVCAIQWKRCVEYAEAGLVDADFIKIRYEDFVVNPEDQLDRICRTLGIPATSEELRVAISAVSKNSVGKGARQMGDESLEALSPLIEETLTRLGYE